MPPMCLAIRRFSPIAASRELAIRQPDFYTALAVRSFVFWPGAHLHAAAHRSAGAGLSRRSRKFSAAVTLTRITFPYLLFITLVTLQSGTLNARGHFAAAAFAPVLLNLVMILCLAVAFLFPNAAIAAAVGVTVSGLCQFALTYWALRRDGLHEHLAGLEWSKEIRHFFVVLGPAVIGSAGVQLALFADTIIGSMLPTGGVSSIYYADRIYQLPIGIIGDRGGHRAFARNEPAAGARRSGRRLSCAKPHHGAVDRAWRRRSSSPSS